MAEVKKVALIGIDAPIPKRIYKYVKEGKLLHLGRLIKEGVFAENCLVPHPTITPPNWTTIVTGAWPGTHGITGFSIHFPGEPLNKMHQAFLSEYCRAQYIWNAAEDVGKKCIIFNYPSTWPTTLKNGIQVGGAGLSINEWRLRGSQFEVSLGAEQAFTTEEYPRASQIELTEAKEWENMPAHKRALEAPLKIIFPMAYYPVEEPIWWLLVLDTKGKGFDKVILAKEKDAGSPMAEISQGEWSGRIRETFETDKGAKDALFMVKLVELSRDAAKLRLYFTPISCLSDWSFPEDIAKELETVCEGFPMANVGIRPLALEWIDLETYVEVKELENKWTTAAIEYLLTHKEWDLFFMHNHITDWAYHRFLDDMEPLTAKDPDRVAEFQAADLRLYEIFDEQVGKILEIAGKDALIIITSDHGAVPSVGPFVVRPILEKAGLVVTKKDSETGEELVDWSKTRAWQSVAAQVFVNLKGRDPEGFVEPGEEYEKVCEEIIAALYDYVDEKTGLRPVVFALKNKDARILGTYGDMAGDVLFAIRPEFGGSHGVHITTGEFGVGSVRGLFIMAGPGVKKGQVLKRNVWLTDITPTICHLAELPVPRDCEGAIIYQALSNPNAKLEELEKLRTNYRRLEQAAKSERDLTHTYE